MCNGISKTGEQCTREYWLDANGLCRDHKDQHYELQRRRCFRLQQDEIDRRARRQRYIEQQRHEIELCNERRRTTLAALEQQDDEDFEFEEEEQPAPPSVSREERLEKITTHLENAKNLLEAMNEDLEKMQQLLE
jgi:hypothetical protein